MGLLTWVFQKPISKEVKKQVNQYMNEFKYQVPGREQMLPHLVTYRHSEYRTWASGNPVDLIKFYSAYKLVPGETSASSRKLWWEWVGSKDNVPKLHYPAPEMIINQMKSLLFADDLDIYVSVKNKDGKDGNEELSIATTETLLEILKDNDHYEKYQTGVMYETYSGSIGFRPVFRMDISPYPIFIPYPAEKIKLRTELGKIQEVIFEDVYKVGDKSFTLKSHHGKGYIQYRLWNNEGKEVPLSTVQELSEGYKDIVITQDGKKPIPIILAAFKKNRSSSNEFDTTEYGGSDFEGLTDTFNLIDEIYSQKNLYIRRTRPIISLSDRLIQKEVNIDTGKVTEYLPEEFENDTLILRGDEKAKDEVKVQRDIPDFNPMPYDESIKEELKTCWRKIGMAYTTVGLEAHSANISGAALEIKEKSSVIVRANKIKLWQKFLKDAYRILMIFNSLKDAPVQSDEKTDQYTISDLFDHDYIINFPVYNNQTFDERVAEAMKAIGTVYDYKRAVEHGLKYQGYSPEDIEEIVKNIKIEQGIPLIGNEIGGNE